MRTKIKSLLILFLPFIVGLLLAGCSPSAATKATADPVTPGATAPAPTATLFPTATSLPGKVLLVGQDSADTPAVQAALAELSEKGGLTFEKRPGLQKEEIGQEVRIVVSLDTAMNMAELAQAAPQTQFVAFSSADLPAAGNLTVIRRRLENQAFVAGFISVLLSTDYRAGGLLPADGPLGGGLQEAFSNGARYFCGVCAPGWPLGQYYPAVAALPGASDGPSWQAAAAGMFDNQKVEIFYLSAEAARPEVFDYLQGKTQLDKAVLVVGEQAPPDSLKAQWAATVRFDLASALREAWPNVAAGKGGAVIDAALVAENPAPGLLGEGRMRLVKDLIAEMKAGRVTPLSIPKE